MRKAKNFSHFYTGCTPLDVPCHKHACASLGITINKVINPSEALSYNSGASTLGHMATGKIGFFDSGFGGLAIMRAAVARLPLHDFIYLGDSEHAPYGNRTPAEIDALTEKAVNFLFNQGCELVILACNTASCQSLRKLQREYLPRYAPDKSILGVLIPAAEYAAQRTKNNKIGVIATEYTVASRVFEVELKKLNPRISVVQQSCPMLVPLIEAGQHSSLTIKALLKTYLHPLQNAGIDTLILGCTHYELIKSQIAAIAGPSITIVSEGIITAERLADYLARHPQLENKLSKTSERRFFCTKNAQKTFEVLGSEFYGSKISAEQVTL